MVTNFREQKKKQKYLLGVVGIVILTIAGVMYFGLFKGEGGSGVIDMALVNPINEIEIDFSVLDNPFFEKIKPFETIPDYEGEIGRENPFLPY